MGDQQQTARVTHLQNIKTKPSSWAEVKKQDGINTLTIKTGENIDTNSAALFTGAIAKAQRDVGTLIVVDMTNTRQINDSGVKLLKKLNERSWRKACKIRIINCNPQLKSQITQGMTPGTFNLSGSCLTLETPQ